jgi:hypothetical protein
MKNETTEKKIERIVEEYAISPIAKQVLTAELRVLVVSAQLEYIQNKK